MNPLATQNNKHYTLRYYAFMLLIIVIYLATAKAGFLLTLKGANSTPVWVPSGIAMATILLAGYRYWPAIFIGALLVNFQWFYIDEQFFQYTLPLALITAIGNTLEAVLGSYLIRRFTQDNISLDKIKDVMTFIAVGILIAPLFSALIGSISFCTFNSNWANFYVMLRTWWLGDALGIIIVAPMILNWPLDIFQNWKPLKYLEFLLFIVLISIFTYFITSTNYSIEFMIFPILLWSIFRFGKLVTFSFLLASCLFALWMLVSSSNESGAIPNKFVIVFQLFFGAVSITLLILSAALFEITNSKKQIQLSEDRFKTIINSINDGVLVHDSDTLEIRYVNKNALDMFGYSLQDMQKLQINELSSNIAPYTHLQNVDWISKAKKGKPQLFEWQSKHKNGFLFWVEINMRTAIIDGKEHVLVVLRDINERKKAAEMIVTSEKKYRDIIELTSDVVYILDEEGNFSYINEAGFKLLELAPNEIIGKPWISVIHPDDRENSLNKFMDILTKKMDLLLYENRFVSKSGKKYEMLHNIKILLDEEGISFGTQGIAKDITEHKKITREIHELNATLEQKINIRTAELELNNQKLERMNKLFVGREIRMVELKVQIAALKKNIPS